MPDLKHLKIGDKIRIVCIPKEDQAAYDNKHHSVPEETYLARKWMVGKEFEIYKVAQNWAWVEFSMPGESTDYPVHSMAIMDDDSWEYAQ